MNRLFLHDGAFHLSFPYDPNLVELAKTIPGARWHKQKRIWQYPVSQIIYEDLKKKFGVVLPEFEGVKSNGKINLATRKFRTPLYEHQKEGLKFLLERMGVEVES
jgi:hypothetical protein